MDGLLLVDKPVGWTSFDVVAKVRSALKVRYGRLKVGHTGTLDPAATGLLVIVIGRYTKRAQEFSGLDKEYQAEIILGSTSTTGDKEGEIMVVDQPSEPSSDMVKKVCQSFVGAIQQTPPAYSAIKVDGKRAYQLARSGLPVDLKPRQVTIHRISNLKYEYPALTFNCLVSSGTYIRSLAMDIGTKLLTAGYLGNLRRTKVGKWSVDKALSVSELNPTKIESSVLMIDHAS